MKYIVAAIACLGIFLVYVALGLYLFGWKYGGGALPQLLMFAAMFGAARAIIRNWPKAGVRDKGGNAS